MLVLIDELKLQILRGKWLKRKNRHATAVIFFTFSNSERRIRAVLTNQVLGES